MEVINASMLLIMLLNPFLVILYLIDIVKKQDLRQFAKNLARAGIYSIIIFTCFAVLGDVIFENIFKTNFASFQIFGGIVFLIIGIQFVLRGTTAIDTLRGESGDVSSAIAMPILIGPGTISASVLIGKKLSIHYAVFAIVVTVAFSVSVMIVLKVLHDYLQTRRKTLIERYIEVAGRILALYVGAISVDMIMKGVKEWAQFISQSI